MKGAVFLIYIFSLCIICQAQTFSLSVIGGHGSGSYSEGDTIYIDFETPLYKLRFGNFINRKNAEKTINKISRLGAQDSWIIRTKIDMDK